MTPTQTIADYITKASLDAQGSLTLLKESLTKELALMPKFTKSKERQLEWVNNIESEVAAIFEQIDRFDNLVMRLEGCCLSHGVGVLQIKDFATKPMIEVVTDTKASIRKQYRIPYYLVEQFEGEIKTATKPLLKWTYIDGKLTPDKKLKLTTTSIVELLQDINNKL